MKHVVIIGGGAAGFFAAINCAEKNPDYNIIILEKSSSVLNKVKISGGGRCNVTHACFDAKELTKFYPRGEKQLLGPFTKFNPSNTIDWFSKRGVEIKREDDGRMFPVTDSSQTIIDCFLSEVKRLRVNVRLRCGAEEFRIKNSEIRIKTSTGEEIIADAVIVTTGSSHDVWRLLKSLGHKIVTPVPSLFTFNIKDERIKGLEGLCVAASRATVQNHGTKQLSTIGPLLITHWGLSGPAILKLSAFAARELAERNHKFEIEVNWVNKDFNSVKELLKQYKQNNPKKGVASNALFDIPKRLWEKFAPFNLNYADLSNAQIDSIARQLTTTHFNVVGKSTFKDEFVTSGGVDLKEIDFRTMQSKVVANLFFAGEVLDIDAITGGFNFQAAWTTGWIAAQSV